MCAGRGVILMFIMTINVLLHSFYYNCIESKTESIQMTDWIFSLKKRKY